MTKFSVTLSHEATEPSCREHLLVGITSHDSGGGSSDATRCSYFRVYRTHTGFEQRYELMPDGRRQTLG